LVIKCAGERQTHRAGADELYPGKEHWLLPLLAGGGAGAAVMDQFAAPEVY
jgi:hypothetical protein